MDIKTIIKKLKTSDYRRRQYGGCLTPVEIIELCDNGAQPNDKHWVERAKEQKEKGISNPQWFYCSLNKELTEIFVNVHYVKKQTTPHFRKR